MAVTLTQTQIIQSLGEALSWFERELNWGVKAADLNHLTGRIGELYVAMTTRGQMALDTNQRGYDVVSAEGERISVKTVTSAVHVQFSQNTLSEADRVVLLRLRIDDDSGITIEEMLDMSVDDLRPQLRQAGGKLRLTVRSARPRALAANQIQRVTDQVMFQDLCLKRFENGSITVERDGIAILPAKPELRRIASAIGLPIETDAGRVKTTHQLGSQVIKAIADSVTG